MTGTIQNVQNSVNRSMELLDHSILYTENASLENGVAIASNEEGAIDP